MCMSGSKSITVAMVLVPVALTLLGGCAASPEVEDRFLQTTGSTWRVAGEPLVFQRTEARYSRSAHDYTYVGPVALNRRGTYDYFLWIGIGSTLDRGFLAPEDSAPESLLLFIDDEPHVLSLMDWDQRVSALPDVVPYDPPVTVRWSMAARITHDQIELISDRGIGRLVLQSASGDAREFQPWGERIDWNSFVQVSP